MSVWIVELKRKDGQWVTACPYSFYFTRKAARCAFSEINHSSYKFKLRATKYIPK